MRPPARVLVLAAALVGWSAFPAHAGTIVFDFESGLQGWELNGAVQRVQTQLLGGEWAIFGDGWIPELNPPFFFEETVLHGEVDLTGIASMDLERLFIEGDRLKVVMSGIGPGNLGLYVFTSEGEIDLTELLGLWHISISWQFADPRIIDGEFVILEWITVGFIDNITFHTIPEPSVLGMLALGGLTLIRQQRRH